MGKKEKHVQIETKTLFSDEPGLEVTIEREVIEPPRVAWDSKLQYFFMVISYAVGLGNVWRFPYLCQKNGGGAFLIPYLIMLFIEGMPLLYLEFAVGQHFRRGSMGVWSKVHPYLAGIGVASAVTSFMVGVYYNAIIMWCFYYVAHSFQYPLPWSDCERVNGTIKDIECEKGGPTSYFWYRQALDISSGIDEGDGIKWKMLLCLLFAWGVIYACIWKGIKSSGKVVYITATFPYIVLIIFFGRGVTLRGASDGLLHLFTPKIERLGDPQVWLDAATQIFYSFGLGFGGLIAFSSYNPKENNCQRDAIIVALTNWFTAVFSSTVIFAVLGFKATLMFETCQDRNIRQLVNVYPHLNESLITRDVYLQQYQTNSTIQSVLFNETLMGKQFWFCDLKDDLNKAAEGTGLAFVVFTQAIVEFGPSAPFWSIIFFLMLLSLGIGSEFGTLEGVTTSIYDIQGVPILQKKWLVSGVLCLVSCAIGIIFVLGSGSYWVALFDAYAGSFPLITVALMEAVSIGWVYGVDRFADDVAQMIGSPISCYWKITWKYISPLMIAGLLIATFISKIINPITYTAYDKHMAETHERSYPWYAGMMAAILVLSSTLCIPGNALLRKLGILKMSYSKKAQADMQGVTCSTVAFTKDAANDDKDSDSGHSSEELNSPFVDSPRDTSCAIEEDSDNVKL